MRSFTPVMRLVLFVCFANQQHAMGLKGTTDEVRAAINYYEQELISKKVSEFGPLDLSHTKKICLFEELIEKIFTLLPLSFLMFSKAEHTNLGLDILTGNPFVEGTSEEEIIRLNLNQSLIKKHKISLIEEFEIFLRLREDQTNRSHYLDNKANKNLILATLQKREARLFQKLRALTDHIFHFRRHPFLEKHQEQIAFALIILIPTIMALYLTASLDFESNIWHDPTPQLIEKNFNIAQKKFISLKSTYFP